MIPFAVLVLLNWMSVDGEKDNNEVVVQNFFRDQNTSPNVTLSLVKEGSPLFHVTGETGNVSSVFSTFKEDSSRYISITLGNITISQTEHTIIL